VIDYPLYDFDEELIASVAGSAKLQIRIPELCVVLGRGGKEIEINRKIIEADEVPIYRRRGGGCAVVIDPGNLIISLVAPMPGVGGVTTAFRKITDWMIDGLAKAGCPDVTWDGTSDLVLNNKKIGGSCIWRTKGIVYYSTTLLVNPDFDLINKYLPHPPREPEYRAGRGHLDFLDKLPIDMIELEKKLELSLEPKRIL
jgi:lipoate---protein ligase